MMCKYRGTITKGGYMSLVMRFVMIFVFVCTLSCRDRTKDPSVAAQMDKVCEETGLIFSDDSILKYFFEPDRFVDPVWVAKVAVPISFCESFKSSLLSKPDDNTLYQGALSDSIDWWKPSNIILTKQYLADSQTFVKVVVSMENEEMMVYIECATF